jgi:hypothetical protein
MERPRPRPAQPAAREDPRRAPPRSSPLVERSAALPAARPGTRALQLPSEDDGTQQLDVADFRKKELSDDDVPSEPDELDLYTDDAVKRDPRRKR